MKKIVAISLFALAVSSCNKTIEKLEDDNQKASYGIGMQISKQTEQFEKSLPLEEKFSSDDLVAGMKDVFSSTKGLSKSKFYGMQLAMQVQDFIKVNKLEDKIDTSILIQGVLDVINKKETLMKEEDLPVFLEGYMKPLVEKAQKENQEAAEKRMKQEAKENGEASKKFLDENKSKSGVKTTPSGLQYEVIKEGDGKTKVAGNEIVLVKYKGSLIDGKVFDSSEKSNGGNPIEFPVTNVIPGWQEGIKLMSKGGKYKLYIPANLAYGEQGGGPSIGPNQALIFEVELLDVKPNVPQEPQMNLNANGKEAIPEDAHGH